MSLCQELVDDLSEVTVTDKAERVAELSNFPAGNKSSGSLKNSSESDLTPVAIGSTETFAARTTAVTDMAGLRGLSNGQMVGEHTAVGGLWPDMQLGASDMMAFSGSSMPLYAPLMVNCACLWLVLSPVSTT